MKVVFATNEDGSLKLKDGKPYLVQVDGEGKEVKDLSGLDINDLYAKAVKLDKQRREDKDKQSASVKSAAKLLSRLGLGEDADEADVDRAIEGLKAKEGDPTEADFEKRVAKIRSDFEAANKRDREKHAEENARLRSVNDELVVSQAFSNSTLFSGDKSLVTLPVEVARVYFKDFVRNKDGKAVVILNEEDGPIMSPTNIGETATLDEALPQVIERLPENVRKSIIRQKEAKQIGGRPESRRIAPTSEKLTKYELNKNPIEKVEFIQKHGRDAFDALPDRPASLPN